MKIFSPVLKGTTLSDGTSNLSGSFTGSLFGTAATASYVVSSQTDQTQNTRLQTLESVTGSYASTSSLLLTSASVAAINVRTGSYATTGSNSFNGSQTVTGSLTATGTITAQTLVVQTITASVEYVSGSNRFGSTTGNTHEFTGSVLVSGSQSINGTLGVAVGGVTELNVQQTGVTLGNVIGDFHRVTGSLNISGSQIINGTAAFSNSITGSNSNGIGGLFTSNTFFGSVDLQNTGGDTAGKWNIQSVSGTQVGGSAGSSFGVYSYGASTYRLFINSSGNVGIGTINPSGTYGKLSVAGGIRILDDNNAKLEIGRYSSGAANSYIKLGANSNSLRITNNIDSVDIFTITNGGYVGIGTTDPTRILYTLGTAGGAEWVLEDSASSSNQKKFNVIVTNNKTQFRVLNDANTGGTIWLTTDNSTGYVGIGTTSVGVPLEVRGAKQTIVSTDNGVLNIVDSSGFAANSGGSLVFRGIYNSAGATAGTGFIDTLKDNGTDGNYSYAMTFGSRSNGSSSIERMRIASSGNIGIGTTSPLVRLHVGDGSQSAINGAGNKIHIASATSGGRSALVTLANSSGAVTVEGQFESSAESGDLRVIVGSTSNHPVVFRANNTEYMRITNGGQVTLSNSTGIRFSGGSSNLNYYEEGTWTPSIVGGGGGEATYPSLRLGWYTRIGRSVTITWFVSITKNNMSGTLRMTGLPFTLLGGSAHYPQGTVLLDSLATATNNITFQAATNTTSGDFIGGNGSTSTHTGLPISVLGSGTMECRGTVTYFV